jgi:hypothetical protein
MSLKDVHPLQLFCFLLNVRSFIPYEIEHERHYREGDEKVAYEAYRLLKD